MSIVTYNNRSIANISAIPGAARSLTHIKTLTASSSSTLTFVDGSSDVVFDSTYPIYKFQFISIHPSNDAVGFKFNLSSDGGSSYNVAKTTTMVQSYHGESDSYVGGGGIAYGSSHDLAQSTASQELTAANQGNGSDEAGSGELLIFNPSSTTFVKHFLSNMASHYISDYGEQDMCGGYANTTSAIDAVKFEFSAGTIESGTIKLYGIKDS
tara:strand:- start:498 stop:1130 length:633 start_codon:yes stop_codon:yes gene_type:complete